MLINIIIFIAIFSLLILVHEIGHFVTALMMGMKVEEFGIGFPPRIFSIKKKGIIYSVNSIPLGGFVKILGEDGDEKKDTESEDKSEVDVSPDPNKKSFASKKIWQRVVVLSAGVTMNFLLGFVLLFFVFNTGVPKSVVIADVANNSPASIAGIQSGDMVVGFEASNDLIKFIDSNIGNNIKLEIDRGGKNFDINVIPRKNPPKGEGALGVALVDSGVEASSWYGAVWDALKASFLMFGFIFVMLFRLIWSLFTGGGLFSQVSGPIGIYKATTQATALGWVYLANIVALISLNLAAINIFPLPALDGGRVLFLIIEKIKGSPVNIKIQQWVNSVAFLLLILLMIVVTVHDVLRLL